MRIALLPFALSLAFATLAARADVLLVPEGDPIPEILLPAKGLTMAQVAEQFGEPRDKRPTVGGDTKEQPPITRWDYDGFAVIFERDRVVDGVIPGAPPRIYNKDELQPARAPAPWLSEEPAADAPPSQ